jgi:excisionase family DNA binding protein
MRRHEFPAEKPYFTVTDVSERWLCSPKKIRLLIKKGELIAHRFGSQIRIGQADLLTYERLNRMA